MLQGLEEQHDLEAVAVDAGEVGARRGPAWTRLRASSIRRRRWWRLHPLGPVDACTNQFRTISRTTIARKPVIASRPRAERRGGRERGEDDEPRRDRRRRARRRRRRAGGVRDWRRGSSWSPPRERTASSPSRKTMMVELATTV